MCLYYVLFILNLNLVKLLNNVLTMFRESLTHGAESLEWVYQYSTNQPTITKKTVNKSKGSQVELTICKFLDDLSH